MQAPLFNTIPVEGEHWDKPDSKLKPLLIDRVWEHEMHNGELWVRAGRSNGDWSHIGGPVKWFLSLGYVKVK
jgi:hypothetical protein